jgi:hypothetical protein
MAKYLGIGSQLLKEKLGKASSQVVESKEFLDSKQELFSTRDAFKSIIETTASVYKATKTHVPAQEFYDNYIKHALKCEKDYRYSKLDLDSKNSALASARSKGKQEKLPAAQAKADQAAAVFDSAKTALSEAIATVIAGRDEAYKNTIDTACKALQDLPSGWDSKVEGDGAATDAPAAEVSGIPDPTHHQTLPPSPKQEEPPQQEEATQEQEAAPEEGVAEASAADAETEA